MQLSKGFRVVSTPLRLEAVSMGRCARPDFGVAGLPFFHQVLFEVEQEIVSRSLLLSVTLSISVAYRRTQARAMRSNKRSLGESPACAASFLRPRPRRRRICRLHIRVVHSRRTSSV